MGLYNEIYGKCKCPYCGQVNEINEQIKWNNVIPELAYYKIGYKLKTENDVLINDVFDYCTSIRPNLVNTCNSCGKRYKYEVEVEDSVIKDIRPIPLDRIKTQIELYEYKLALLYNVMYFANIYKDKMGKEFYRDIHPAIKMAFDCLNLDKHVDKYTLLGIIDIVSETLSIMKNEPKPESLVNHYCKTHPLIIEKCDRCNKRVFVTMTDTKEEHCALCGNIIKED